MGMSVRKFLIAVLTSLAVVGAHAWESTTTENPPEESLIQAAANEALVTISAVPMPGVVIELANYAPKSPHQVKKVKAAKLARAKSMLSRSAREQIVLAHSSAKPDERARLSASDDEEADTGLDDLDLHRSFSQPKVAKAADQIDDEDDDDAGADLSDHVKLRLLMARTRAVEALVLNQAAQSAQSDQTEVSEAVQRRLSLARAKAMDAYHAKFGAA